MEDVYLDSCHKSKRENKCRILWNWNFLQVQNSPKIEVESSKLAKIENLSKSNNWVTLWKLYQIYYTKVQTNGHDVFSLEQSCWLGNQFGKSLKWYMKLI